MAQTQKKSSSGRSSASRSRSKSTSTKSRNGSSAQSTASRSSANGQSKLGSVTDTVTSGAKNAAETVGNASSKAKTGLLAGGAAAIGLAATAIATRNAHSKPKVLGVSLPSRKHGLGARAKSIKLPKRSPGMRKQTQRAATKVTGAADAADKLGQRVSSVARSVRQVSETANDAAKKA